LLKNRNYTILLVIKKSVKNKQ